jgi:hypothetical protein
MRTFRAARAASFIAFAVVCVASSGSTQPGPQRVPAAAPPIGPTREANDTPPPPPPSVHRSTEVEFGQCPTTFHFGVDVGIGTIDLASSQEDLGRLFPEWWEVGRPAPARDHRTGATTIDTTSVTNVTILEGTVTSKTRTPDGTNVTDHRGGQEYTPHVTHDDTPIAHFTHDINVHVEPDRTPDNRYTNLLGIEVEHHHQDPCEAERKEILHLGTQLAVGNTQALARHRVLQSKLAAPACRPVRLPDTSRQQGIIEVEWESGLGADNEGNVCAPANRRGDSCGFASAGHTRGQELWSWPTEGDHVHVEGTWIFDRGHPPAETEIHSPRLMVVARKLPELVNVPDDIRVGSTNFVSTRVDMFANGDGNAFNNNTKGPYAADYGVRRVPMGDRDYVFRVEQTLMRPGPAAPLKWTIAKRPGDTFPAEPTVIAFPNGSAAKAQPHVEVHIPWKTMHAPHTAIFARTMHLYWADGASFGVAPAGRPRIFEVTLDSMQVKNALDGDDDPGQWRVFAEIGGHWIFVNELYSGDVLRAGLGSTKPRVWPIARKFTVYVPPQGRFRVYAGGWEADGVNDHFGKLIDPNFPCSDALRKKATDLLNAIHGHGGEDDPIGEVSFAVVPPAARLTGLVVTRASAGDKTSDPLGGDTDPNGVFTVTFRVNEQNWPPPSPPPLVNR